MYIILFLKYAKYGWMEGIVCRQRQLPADIYKQVAEAFWANLKFQYFYFFLKIRNIYIIHNFT